ncbi:MAG TPA: peptidoglycan DD-metalloendopeptidase family protein [Trichocoleus sp.]
MIRLIIAWIIFLIMYLYPSLVSLINDPMNTILGTTGTLDPIYSKEIQEGAQIDGYSVTSGYGERTAPKEGASTEHRGVDLATPTGTQLYAFGGSLKVECQQDSGGGLVATLTPSTIEFTFRAMHLDKCESGEFKEGQVWGTTGDSGNSTGPHLHWEQLKDGQHVHPTEGFLWWVLQGKSPKPYGFKAEKGFGDATDKLYQAIIQQESGGDHTAINADSGAIGIGQVMPENVSNWTEQCLGKSLSSDAFATDETAQKQTVSCKLKEYWNAAKERGEGDFDACRSVAAQWYSGDPSLKDSDAPQAGYPSIKAYTESVCSNFQ